MRAARAMRSGGRIFIPRLLPHAGVAALYYGMGGSSRLLGAKGGQDRCEGARFFWLFCVIVLSFLDNIPVFCEAGL